MDVRWRFAKNFSRHVTRAQNEPATGEYRCSWLSTREPWPRNFFAYAQLVYSTEPKSKSATLLLVARPGVTSGVQVATGWSVCETGPKERPLVLDWTVSILVATTGQLHLTGNHLPECEGRKVNGVECDWRSMCNEFGGKGLIKLVHGGIKLLNDSDDTRRLNCLCDTVRRWILKDRLSWKIGCVLECTCFPIICRLER